MSRVQQKSVKAIFFKVVRVAAVVKSPVIGTSLFSFVRVSLVRERRFTVMARSLLGKFCLDSKQKLGIRTGNPEIDKKPWARPKTTIATAASGPNALSSRTWQLQRTNSALKWPALSMKFSSESWAFFIKVGRLPGLSRSPLWARGAPSQLRWDLSLLLGGQVAWSP